MRILVVDDDQVTRMKLQSLLNAYGQCDAVEDGDQGWGAFKGAHGENNPYDLITMDVDMPGMNGHEVVKKIRAWEGENMNNGELLVAKVLMVTSMQSRSDVIASFNEGCENFIRKPIKPNELDECLNKLDILKSV